MLLLVLFVYFLYRNFICCWLIYNYSILIFFNSFYLFFNYLFLRRKNVVNFNINYLHISNIIAVVLSFSFDVMIHFINYLCLNWLILVFNLVLVSFAVFIYVRICVRTIRKSFLKNNSKIIFLFVCLYYLCFSKLDNSSLVFSPKKVLNFNTFLFGSLK